MKNITKAEPRHCRSRSDLFDDKIHFLQSVSLVFSGYFCRRVHNNTIWFVEFNITADYIMHMNECELCERRTSAFEWHPWRIGAHNSHGVLGMESHTQPNEFNENGNSTNVWVIVWAAFRLFPRPFCALRSFFGRLA